ncbi:adenylate/guanylate cyclase domain-containing protein [Rhodococcus sp. D2-41]|uniref:adenylate/guanylate cyclase domain-containing protein n=1 Tax=Speluncibacter jeojiensis TaxID=2710754 RepID=UPI00240F29E9|nr:adenylate/guanylate cyclase domain-containing protein [Rhodococcus sp. D2-41]MDG3009570.1 adenylate/guanylate cyclase domain-containing protein [Rhodococcus sp. D2-41]
MQTTVDNRSEGTVTTSQASSPQPERDSPDVLLERIQAVVEDDLLRGARKYDREQTVALSGVPLDRAQRLWTAMGFAAAEDPHEVMFTDDDVEALRLLDSLITSGIVEPDLEVAVTRALGQTFSRLADWQVTLMGRHVLRRLSINADNLDQTDHDEVVDAIRETAVEIVPVIEALQSYVWRRHLAAVAGRSLVLPDDKRTGRTQVVGFADMVGYTSLTRRIDITELSTLLEDFESTATAVIAQRRGWVIKNVGDEVMFAVEDPSDAAAIALELQSSVHADDGLPALRIGMALGPVLVRFGDAYGSVVNIAARLTSAAKPGTILLDAELADVLGDAPDLRVKALRSMRVRGFHKLKPYVLRGPKPR